MPWLLLALTLASDTAKSQQTRVYPYLLGAGPARPNPKMGAPDPENPLFLGFSLPRGGLRPWSQTMVSEGAKPRGRGRSGDCEKDLGRALNVWIGYSPPILVNSQYTACEAKFTTSRHRPRSDAPIAAYIAVDFRSESANRSEKPSHRKGGFCCANRVFQSHLGP